MMQTTHSAAPARTARQAAPSISTAPIWGALVEALLLPDIPARVSIMTSRASGPKYQDTKPDAAEWADLVAGHWAGERTIAVTLAAGQLARAGCRDYDAGGIDAIRVALESAHAAGLVAFGIAIEGSNHSGGHVWAVYRDPAPACDIRHALAQLPAGEGEIYPQGNPIRLPFGYHRRRGTRGRLLLQDGQSFNLDQPGERVEALRAVLALQRNAPPAPAPAGARGVAGAAWGEHHKLENWQGLPDGRALLQSGRYRFLFGALAQLAALDRGERVTLHTDRGPDDSDSAQVAALIWNLIRSHRKGARAGEGAPPECEIRAIALAMHERLRAGRSLDHYRAHIDAEIERYRPRTYAPEPTQHIGTSTARPSTSKPIEAPQRPATQRGRPRGAAAEHRACIKRALSTIEPDSNGRRVFKVEDLARKLGYSVRAVQAHLAILEDIGEVERGQIPGRGGPAYVRTLWRARGANNSQGCKIVEPVEAPIAEAIEPESTSARGANRGPIERSAAPQTSPTTRAGGLGETHRALCAPCPGPAAPAALVGPQTVEGCEPPACVSPIPPAAARRVGAALWRSSGGDYPKVVTGYGEHGGAWFALCDDSAGGIPADELIWPDDDQIRKDLILGFVGMARPDMALAIAALVSDVAGRADLLQIAWGAWNAAHGTSAPALDPDSAAAMPLWALVREALAAYGGAVAERHAEALASAAPAALRGVKMKAGRELTRMVLRYVADNGPADADPALIRTILRGERLRADLQAMRTAGVRAALRLYETRLDRANKNHDPSCRWWHYAADLARRELARRPAEPGKRRRRGVVEALPDPRAAGERRDREREAAARELLDIGIGVNHVNHGSHMVASLFDAIDQVEPVEVDPTSPAPIEDGAYWSQLGRSAAERLRAMKAARQAPALAMAAAV